MKKSYKILIITACVMMVLGLLVVAAAFLSPNFSLEADHAENVYTYKADGIEKISVTARTQDIKIETGSVNEITVYARENKWEKYEITNTDGTFSIIAKDLRKWYQKIELGIRRWEYDLVVVLPKSLVDTSIDVTVSTGDIHAYSLDVQNLSLKLSTGDIEMSNINAKNITLNLSTGDVDAQDVKAQGLFTKTSTGDIDFIGFEILGKTEISVTTGDIDLSGLKCDTLYIKTSTGDVDLERVYANSHDIRTRTGDVEGRVQPLN